MGPRELVARCAVLGRLPPPVPLRVQLLLSHGRRQQAFLRRRSLLGNCRRRTDSLEASGVEGLLSEDLVFAELGVISDLVHRVNSVHLLNKVAIGSVQPGEVFPLNLE